jgi:16S rRNA (uracil1498-N3)-methyltransferase
MHLFYTPDINENSSEYLLNEEESRHCISVLRLTVDSQIYLIDGKGTFYTAKIISASPKKTLLQIISFTKEFNKRNHYLHIAVAPTKNIDRFEWFLEKATEIGIDEITPIICDRSERKEVKIDRLNKVIIAAIKQSANTYVPKLNNAIGFKSFMQIDNSNSQKFIAHCEDTPKATLKAELVINNHYTLLIGPEGDFTLPEIAEANNAGFMAITLGKSRLRTETAALAVCFEVNFLNR